MNRMRFIVPSLAIAMLLGVSVILSASPRGSRMFMTDGGNMMVFPGDSLDISAMTFMIDGDTVSREAFTAVNVNNIYSITVTKGPANCIELVTLRSMQTPLDPDTLSSRQITMTLNGVEVGADVLSSLPADSVRKVVVVKGRNPAIMISTVNDSASATNP